MAILFCSRAVSWSAVAEMESLNDFNNLRIFTIALGSVVVATWTRESIIGAYMVYLVKCVISYNLVVTSSILDWIWMKDLPACIEEIKLMASSRASMAYLALSMATT